MDTSKLREAIEESSNDGCIIHIKVKIGKRNMFPVGIDEWRNRVEMEISEKPESGKANKKIIEIMAEFFGKSRKDIALKYGKTSREKGIWIRGGKEEIIEKVKNGL